MLNAEKFKDKILSIADDGYLFAIKKNDKGNVIRCCSDMNCQDCIFDDEESEYCGYNIPRLKWLLSEYKEPPVKVSKLEYEFLKWSEKKGHKYIVRDKINHLFIFKDAPIKRENCWVPESSYCSIALFDNLFKFIKQEDEEPRAIKDILENCVVVEDESK